MMNGSATNLKMAKLTTATMRKIQRTSLPFHFADFILKEKKRKWLTIRKERMMVMLK